MGFFEVAIEIAGANAAMFGQSGFSETPEEFHAVDLVFTNRKSLE